MATDSSKRPARDRGGERAPETRELPPGRVNLTALRYHTHRGGAYDVGTTYETDEADAESLRAQLMAADVPYIVPSPARDA